VDNLASKLWLKPGTQAADWSSTCNTYLNINPVVTVPIM